MRTDELIAALAAQTRPMPRGVMRRGLLFAVALGASIATALVVVLYGLRIDFATATQDASFWTKAIFTGSIALLSFYAVSQAARPHLKVQASLALLTVPFVMIGALALQELYQVAPQQRVATLLGQTWRSCPFSIAGLSLVPMAFLMRSLRNSAPSSPWLAGALAGLLAGGIAATAYGLHCPEPAASFVAIWYALGILTSAGIGAIVGRRILRW